MFASDYSAKPLRNHPLKPLSSWPLSTRERIVGVFTDIDDTLTTSGAMTNDALEALQALKAKGLMVIPITGRPVGWSMPFVVVAKPSVDVDAADGGRHAFLLQQTDHCLNLYCRKVMKFTVVKRNVGFAPG